MLCCDTPQCCMQYLFLFRKQGLENLLNVTWWRRLLGFCILLRCLFFLLNWLMVGCAQWSDPVSVVSSQIMSSSKRVSIPSTVCLRGPSKSRRSRGPERGRGSMNIEIAVNQLERSIVIWMHYTTCTGLYNARDADANTGSEGDSVPLKRAIPFRGERDAGEATCWALDSASSSLA